MIIVGYIIRVGTSLSLLAHGGFVGEQPHGAERENLPWFFETSINLND